MQLPASIIIALIAVGLPASIFRLWWIWWQLATAVASCIARASARRAINDAPPR